MANSKVGKKQRGSQEVFRLPGEFHHLLVISRHFTLGKDSPTTTSGLLGADCRIPSWPMAPRPGLE